MGKAEDRLAELLEESENRVRELEEQIEEDADHERWRWSRHSDIKEEQKLPVPRLEIYYEESESDGYNRRWIYRLIHRHFLGHCVSIPLGSTSQTGGRPVTPELSLNEFLPFRDGAHIRHDAKAFGFPAFMVYGDRFELIPLEDRP